MKTKSSMIFNVLLKKEEGTYIAHCLELDIVTTSDAFDEVKSDIIDLIIAQVDYAFSNDNLAYLYRPAPPEVWQAFYECKEQIEKRIAIKSGYKQAVPKFIPPWIIARTCMASDMRACHA